MTPLKKILFKLNGLQYRQDYLCLDKESLSPVLFAYIVKGNLVLKDITNQHLFVGYSPLILAFPLFQELIESVRLIFSHAVLQPGETFNNADVLATLDLRMIKKDVHEQGSIIYYEGMKGEHFFLSRFHQRINKLINKLYNQKPGNIFLQDGLYKQVQIAYSIPRIISVITVSSGGLYNVFPTDLHGALDDDYYIISLRSEGKACKQVEAIGKVLISRVKYGMYKTVYGLGKNHMKELGPKESFPLSPLLSEKLQGPLPLEALSYDELILLDTFVHGIHKIMRFKKINSQRLQAESGTLAHIHNAYATWRYNNKMPGNYLLR